MPQPPVFGTPYCGPPVFPHALWSRWNLDPVLIAVLVALQLAYGLGAWRARRRNAGPSGLAQASFHAGWAVTAAALISPLCPLTVSLFSARVGQHMVLALVAAPLVAAGHPLVALRALLPRTIARRLARVTPAPMTAAFAFALMLWFWHAPVPYAETFDSTTVYWSMHLGTFAAALWLWTCLLDRAPRRSIAVIGAGLISTVQMGLIGALITFAPRPLYAPHALTTAAWHLTQLQDQQLGGAIMWVPGCAVFLIVSMVTLWRVIATGAWQPGPRHAELGTP